MSKADIADKAVVEDIKKQYPEIITDADVLKEVMIKKSKASP
jgi:hypothetical protein